MSEVKINNNCTQFALLSVMVAPHYHPQTEHISTYYTVIEIIIAG